MYTSMMRKALFGSGDSALLSLDFTAGTVPTAVTFTRADSTARATFIDASGYVKTVASAGAARFDYTGGVAKGLLIEAAATNVCTYSQAIASADWNTTTGYTITTNTTDLLSPAGDNTATKLVYTSGYARCIQTVTLAASTTYTMSYWIKSAMTHTFRVYDLTAGADIASSIGSIPVTSSWTRVQKTFTTGASTSSCWFYVAPDGGPTAGLTAYVWGAQIEVGSIASSYVSTTTAARTRLADDAVIRSTAWTSLYAQPGAMVVEFYRGEYGATDRSIICTDTTAARHWHLKSANASATAQIAFSTGSPVTQTGLISGLNKVAIAWNAPTPTASFDLCVNGATPTFGGSNVGTTLSTWLTLGSQSTTGVSGSGTWNAYLNNSIKSVKYYTGLTYAEMQAKTT
jgi:hypothetical protein